MPGHCFICDAPSNTQYCASCDPEPSFTLPRAEYDRLRAVEAEYGRLRQEILDRVMYVGLELPESICENSRRKTVLLGWPQEIMDAAIARAKGEGK